MSTPNIDSAIKGVASSKSDIGAPLWRCTVDAIPNEVGGSPLSALTVGTKFTLNCNGDIPVEWKADLPPTVSFKNPQEEKYTLVILKPLKQEATSASYLVTSYKAGEFSPEYIRILTGDKGFESGGLRWNVQSVLPKDKKPEPYPAFGPYLINMPYWVWGVVLGFTLLVALIVWRIVRRTQQRKKVLRLLETHAAALPPHGQFHKDLRQIKKYIDAGLPAGETSAKLDENFRLYLLRSFRIPALDWSDSEILRDLKKKNYTLYESEGKRVARVMRELGQLKKIDQGRVQDVEQMFVFCRETVDRLEKVKGVLK